MSDPTPHLERFESYEQACRDFRSLIPPRFNIASAICRRHDDAVTRIAVSEVKEAGINTYTLGGLDFLSDKFATALLESGIQQGDSVAVLVPPSSALAIAHLGALKCGAVVVPISMTADSALVEYAIADSGASAFVVDESMSAVIGNIAHKILDLKSIFVVRDLRPVIESPDVKDFWTEVDRCSSDFAGVETDADSPALIFYLEAQGEIVGVVHSHRSLIGQLCAFEMFNCPGVENLVFWSAGDWSSPAEILGLLYPVWWYGCSLVAGAAVDPAGVLRLLERCEVTNVFIPSPATGTEGVFARDFRSNEDKADAGTTVLPGTAQSSSELKIRTVVAEAQRWPEYLVKANPSAALNEVRGRAETGFIFGTCDRLFATEGGSAGRRVPGRVLEIIDSSGNALPPGLLGHIAVHTSDSGLFAEYRGTTRRTEAFIGEWFLTGAVGYKNEDGELYITPSSRG